MDANEIMGLVNPEIAVLIPVLFLIGAGIKRSGYDDRKIPVILGGLGIIITWVYLATTQGVNGESLFQAVVQGVLCAAGAVYCHQIYKQSTKEKGE